MIAQTYKTPQVSIIIINYNTFELTSQCIESVYAQTSGVDFEIILVDNASTECRAEQFEEQFPAIKLIKSTTNVGFSKGNNLGLKSAQGEIILLLNSDTQLLNNAILLTHQKLVADEGIGVITGKLVYADGSLQYQCGRFPSIRLHLIELFRVQKLMSAEKRGRVLLGGFFNHETEIEPDWVWGTFFMVRQEVINQLPESKLPDNFFMYAEDLQWCYLIKKLGWRIKYVPEALVKHLFGQSIQKVSTIRQHELIEKNSDLFLKEYHGYFYTRIIYLLKRLIYLSGFINRLATIRAGVFKNRNGNVTD